MIKRIVFFVLIFVAVQLEISAQQLPQFTQYIYNTVAINPAYAGSRGAFNITALGRKQWVNVDGAPQTYTLSVNTPLKDEKIGVGGTIINDEIGYQNFLTAYGNFSYTVRAGYETKLSFGLNAGITQPSLDFGNDALDPAITNDVFFNQDLDRLTFNAGAGVYLHSDRWFAGLSAPRLIPNDINTLNDVEEIEYVALERISYYLMGGHVFDAGLYLKIKPSAMLKFTNGAPASLDTSINFLVNEKLWLGANYRFDGAVGAIADFQISEDFRIGYAYEVDTGNTTALNSSGSHEILLIYEIKPLGLRFRSPRYF